MKRNGWVGDGRPNWQHPTPAPLPLRLQLGVSLILSFMAVWDLPAIKRGVASLRTSRLAPVYRTVAPSVEVFATLFGKALQAQVSAAQRNGVALVVGWPSGRQGGPGGSGAAAHLGRSEAQRGAARRNKAQRRGNIGPCLAGSPVPAPAPAPAHPPDLHLPTPNAQARIACVNTILTLLGMWVLQIPGIGLLSMFVFICGFIPIAGVIISTFPIGFVALTEYGFLKVLG